MNRLRQHLTPASLWLALLLFVGQLLAVAHATQHELAAPGDQSTCEICIVAHGAGALPVASASTLPHGKDSLSIAARPARLPRLAIQRPRSRAPPELI